LATVEILNAATPERAAQARQLIEEYAAWLAIDLSYQGFDEELATLPGRYAPPSGRLLLAMIGGEPAGCVGLRDLGGGICEMKRMWVRPEFMGYTIGRRLGERAIAEVRAIGYAKMRPDTGRWMTEATTLYRLLGFREIPAYCYNPSPEALFFELGLT